MFWSCQILEGRNHLFISSADQEIHSFFGMFCFVCNNLGGGEIEVFTHHHIPFYDYFPWDLWLYNHLSYSLVILCLLSFYFLICAADVTVRMVSLSCCGWCRFTHKATLAYLLTWKQTRWRFKMSLSVSQRKWHSWWWDSQKLVITNTDLVQDGTVDWTSLSIGSQRIFGLQQFLWLHRLSPSSSLWTLWHLDSLSWSGGKVLWQS